MNKEKEISDLIADLKISENLKKSSYDIEQSIRFLDLINYTVNAMHYHLNNYNKLSKKNLPDSLFEATAYMANLQSLSDAISYSSFLYKVFKKQPKVTTMYPGVQDLIYEYFKKNKKSLTNNFHEKILEKVIEFLNILTGNVIKYNEE